MQYQTSKELTKLLKNLKEVLMHFSRIQTIWIQLLIQMVMAIIPTTKMAMEYGILRPLSSVCIPLLKLLMNTKILMNYMRISKK